MNILACLKHMGSQKGCVFQKNMGSLKACLSLKLLVHVSSRTIFSNVGNRFGKAAAQWLCCCSCCMALDTKNVVHGNQANGITNVAFGMVLF